MAEEAAPQDVWAVGAAYESYVGRWSRPVARELIRWLDVPARRRWLDVGCGTGALTEAILAHAEPESVVGVDRSEGFVEHVRSVFRGPAVEFRVGDAQALPVPSASVDVAVSGLVLNFVLEPARMVAEMARAVRPGCPVALYVWDYGAGMELIRRFWDAARTLDPAVAELDEAARFPICAPGPLQALFEASGLGRIETRAIDVPTPFRSFDDYWAPFLGGQGPAPTYLMSLDDDRRNALCVRIRQSLPVAADGSIKLSARAWAVRGC
jgi:SAM-dependent methyltransferase